MHDFRELRRIVDADTLIAAGVGKIATLQTKGRDDIDMPTRRDALYRFLDDVTARARAASERQLPSLRADGFAGAVGGVMASADPGGCPFLLREIGRASCRERVGQ